MYTSGKDHIVVASIVLLVNVFQFLEKSVCLGDLSVVLCCDILKSHCKDAKSMAHRLILTGALRLHGMHHRSDWAK